jgi:RHS repeat-associated protein
VNGAETSSEWTIRDHTGRTLRRYHRTGGSWTWTGDYIYRDGVLLAAEMPGPDRTLHFHPDHLGTPRLITGSGGAELSRHTYYPFGREASAPSQDTERAKFTGHERDDINLDYMHARYYLPYAGRFLSVDPGRDWDSQQPQSWNMYTYVRNNPANATDPQGRELRYTDQYKALVRNNPTYAKAHRLWYNSPQGRAQHRTMGEDRNTVYTIGVGKVTLTPFTNEQRAGGTWPPAHLAKRDRTQKLDAPDVNILINVDYLSEPKLDVSTAAETLFHEVTHGVDVGSGTRTRDEAGESEQKLEEQDGEPDPRLEEYRRMLEERVPPH